MCCEGNLASVVPSNLDRCCFVGIRLGRINFEWDGESELAVKTACTRIYTSSRLKLPYDDPSEHKFFCRETLSPRSPELHLGPCISLYILGICIIVV